MLTPYEQYFIQTLHHEGQLVPEQAPGEKNLLLQLAINPSYTPLEETSQASSFIPNTYIVPHCSSPDHQPTTTTGTCLLIH
jgi:hypothetical protein